MASPEREPETPEPEEKETLLSVLGSLGFLVLLVFAFKSSVLDANNIPSGSMIPTLKIGDYLFVNKMRYSLRIPFTNAELFRYDNPQRGDIVTFIPPDREKHYVKRVIAMPGDRFRIRRVRACDLGKVMGKGPAVIPTDYGIVCGSVHEPELAYVEYREMDRGPWRNYGPTMLPGAVARAELMDADNSGVLPIDLHPPQRSESRVPVIFEETIGGRRHRIVESASSMFVENAFSCEDSQEAGCLVPPDQYMVMGDNRDDSKDSRALGFIRRDMIQGKALIIYFSINWQDGICKDYVLSADSESVRRGHGFRLPDFPPEKQARYCSTLDKDQDHEPARAYLERTLRYRIPRMNVRWSRLLRLLN